MPLPPIQQNGDAGRLEQLASGLKRQNGTSGPVLQRNPAGRPQGTGGTPAPRASQPQQQGPVLTPDMEMAAREVAIAEWARQYWARLAAQYPSAWTQLYQQQTDSVAGIVHQDYYNSTPNFED